ncbi:MAG: peptidoglycan DD-metalloendopeptidase family protein [Bacteroidetes bacterium]|nr:peptidoglycan DD-metalloendopeptidase family protein [Bacteroidota bacterium]
MTKRFQSYSSIFFLALVLVACSLGSNSNDQNSAPLVQSVEEVAPVNTKFGFNLDDFHIQTGHIEKNQVLSQILSPFGISALQMDALANNSREVFDVRRIKPKKQWHLLQAKDSSNTPQYFIYESSPRDYYVFQLQDSIHCWKGQHPTEKTLRYIEGEIDGSLYQTIADQGAPTLLTLEIANLYAWSIDFYRIQKGDAVSMLYEIETVDSVVVGAPRILASNFKHKDRDFNAFCFENDGRWMYYDEEGRSMKKAFLKAPVEYSRISSKFTKKRYHPVLKRYKAHLGTDYAAPRGTPIVAVADGTVTKSSYTSGNGKFVKIKHNSVYETQYLHMSKRAVNVGDFVKQGDVIGYVGSTGLATGPHVCFRFWKNGEQVNPLTEELPSAEPLQDSLMPSFILEKDRLIQLQDSLKNELTL